MNFQPTQTWVLVRPLSSEEDEEDKQVVLGDSWLSADLRKGKIAKMGDNADNNPEVAEAIQNRIVIYDSSGVSEVEIQGEKYHLVHADDFRGSYPANAEPKDDSSS